MHFMIWFQFDTIYRRRNYSAISETTVKATEKDERKTVSDVANDNVIPI